MKTHDGETITGDSVVEVVTALRDGSKFGSDQDLKTYMGNFAERWHDYSGELIDHSNVYSFFDDLIFTGYWSEIL